MALRFNENSPNLPSLPPFDTVAPASISTKEKATVALQVLRRTAAANRQSKGRPFYSIRAVAKHFCLSTATVTRMYGQLKAEGVLGTLWGSQTIIEPAQLDHDIRVKALVALPVPLRATSATSTHRRFIGWMQRALWKERFASQPVFYDETMFSESTVANVLLDTGAHIVAWLMPPVRRSDCLARLSDKGVKSVIIADEMPINGEPGYFLDWRSALLSGLENWKLASIRKILLVKQSGPTDTRIRSLKCCLADAELSTETCEAAELRTSPNDDRDLSDLGIIFGSEQALLKFLQAGAPTVQRILRNNRVLLAHGEVDLPYLEHLNRCFDTVKFDWQGITRQLVRDLNGTRWASSGERQTIFEARWHRRPIQ